MAVEEAEKQYAEQRGDQEARGLGRNFVESQPRQFTIVECANGWVVEAGGPMLYQDFRGKHVFPTVSGLIDWLTSKLSEERKPT